ncbi:MAG: AIR synthase family protein [Lachnospiraceae bacterium]|nr:AIR synthase family protein [Lachnospiraceae bacterium]
MKIGKVPENVLKRSVLKQIKYDRKEVLLGPGVGEDCAAVELADDEIFVLSTDPITGTVQEIGRLAVHVTANDLASAGADPIGLLLTVLLPPEAEEPMLRELMKDIMEECARLEITVMGGHTEVTAAVCQPLVSVTGVGKVKKGKLLSTGGIRPGQEIIMTKYAGLEGTAIIAAEKEKELLTRYPASFIEEAKEMVSMISVVEDAKIAREYAVTAMHDVTEGGIFGALWEVAVASKVGLEIELQKIPLRQQTVEICEFFDLNPYMLISSGSMLIAADRGSDVVDALKKQGIHAAVIGRATDGNDKVVYYGDEKRYLEPPKCDELYKIYES